MALCSSDRVALKLMLSAVHSRGPSGPPLKTVAHLSGEGEGERKDGARNSSKLL